MFLDHTLDTKNTKKHKMIPSFIQQFKQIKISNENHQLDEIIKYDILSKLCRRCTFSQLESIIDVFDLRAQDNQEIVIKFINEQIDQHQDIVFISHMTKVLKLIEINAIPFEKVFIRNFKLNFYIFSYRLFFHLY